MSGITFTQDELMLLVLYNPEPSTREGLIAALQNMQTQLTKKERRLRALSSSAVAKLKNISDEDFAALPLVPELDIGL